MLLKHQPPPNDGGKIAAYTIMIIALLTLVFSCLQGCYNPNLATHFWQVQDHSTHECIGVFGSKERAQKWIDGWKQDREVSNAETAKGIPNDQNFGFSPYQFDRDLQPIRRHIRYLDLIEKRNRADMK